MSHTNKIKSILYKLQNPNIGSQSSYYDQFFNLITQNFQLPPYKIYKVTSVGGGHKIQKNGKQKKREFEFHFNLSQETFSLSISRNYLINKAKLGLVLNIHFLYQIIFNVIRQPRRAENIAFALLWDLSTEPKEKEMVFKLWKELHTPIYDISPYIKVSLSDFVVSLEKSGFQSYFEDFITRFLEYGTRRTEETEIPYFEYRCSKFPMRHFSPNNMNVFKDALSGPGLKIRDVRNRCSLSRQTVSTSLKKLISSFILIPGVHLSVEKLNLSSIFLIFKTKFRTKVKINDLGFSGLASFNILTAFDNVHIVNFLQPDTETHKNNLKQWWDEITSSLQKIKAKNFLLQHMKLE